jgi:hypothetical protein
LLVVEPRATFDDSRLIRPFFREMERMRHSVRASLVLPVLSIALAGTGCSLPALIERNTRTVGESTAGIAANSRTVERSTVVTERLLPAMEGLGALRQPMEDLGTLRQPMVAVAGLRPSLASVAALETPMSRLAALDAPMREVGALAPEMRAVAQLAGPMDRVAQMRASLDGVSGLRAPMERVASLQPDQRAVADLQGSMRELATLREPMMRLAAMGGVLGNPLALLAIAVVGLGAWGVVTYVAVRFAVARALAPSRPR